jgi:hypothetical protein
MATLEREPAFCVGHFRILHVIVIVKVSTFSFLILIQYRGNLIPVLSKHVIKNVARKIR